MKNGDLYVRDLPQVDFGGLWACVFARVYLRVSTVPMFGERTSSNADKFFNYAYILFF